MEDKVYIILGATASGKTSYSIDLAKKINGEIINGDSIQMYKGFNIGSAKVTKNEMDGVKHHLLDFLKPEAVYTVKDFQYDVRQLVKNINSRGKIPIICGGTGLYLSSVIFDYEFYEDNSDSVNYDEFSNDELHENLSKIDPAYAQKIPKENRRRVISGIKYYNLTGKRKSDNIAKNYYYKNIDIHFLNMDRDRLYKRINKRVDMMFDMGLENEVIELYKKGYKDTLPFQGIGYKEFIPYFYNQINIGNVKDNIKQNSRNYAKRQLTWIRNKIKKKTEITM